MATKDPTQWVDLPLLLDWTLDQKWAEFSNARYSALNQADGLHLLGTPVVQRLINLCPEKRDNRWVLRRRETVTTSGFTEAASTRSAPRGIFYFPLLNLIAAGWGTGLYTSLANGAVTTTTSMGTSTSGPIGACEGLNTAGTAYAFVASTTKSVSISPSHTVTTISDSDYPSPVIPMPVFMDQYTFIAKEGTRSIYNSAVGDETSWSTTAFINTEESAGNVVGLVRHHKNIVALCTDHTEFFRDGAIAAPNSPLIRETEKVVQIGCVNRATIATFGDITIFMGRAKNGQVGIYKLEDFQIQKISNASVDWLTNFYGGMNGNYGVISSWTDYASSFSSLVYTTGYFLKMHEKLYYVLSVNGGQHLDGSGSNFHLFPSVMYDFESKIWIELAHHYQSTGDSPDRCVGGWPFPFGAFIYSNTSGWSNSRFIMQMVVDAPTGEHILQLSTVNDNAEIVNTTTGAVNSNAHSMCVVQWPLLDFDHVGLKTLSGLYFADEGSDNDLLQVSAGALTTSWSSYGQYISDSSITLAKSFLLNPLTYTPPAGQRAYIIRNTQDQFYQKWFMLQIRNTEHRILSKIKVRITSHEEQ